MRLTGPNISLSAGLVALASVGIALVSQHRYGMEPCPWCVLQRLLFVLVGVLGLLAWLARPRVIAKLAMGLSTVASVGGLAAAVYQNLVASKSASCNLTLADRLISLTRLDHLMPEVFEVRSSCADAAVKLLGVPYEIWSAALFVILGVVFVVAYRRS